MPGNEQNVSRERGLLLGVTAVQLKLVSPAQLAMVAEEWRRDFSLGLGELLVARGFLEAEQKRVLEELLGVEVKKHGSEAQALKSLGGEGAVTESFGGSMAAAEEVGSLVSFGGEVSFPEGREGITAVSRLDDAGSVTLEHPGRYTIKSEHGRGGIGRVLIAFDEHVGREVALKELLPEVTGSTSLSGRQTPLHVTAASTARFLREARITGQLEHPGIVPVYEVGKRPDGSIYYTMKLVRGKTLADRLAECRNLSERLRYLPHFLDLCQTIAYAHSRGVIHRDIKPQNMMVGEFGETVVLDWGLAKVRGISDIRAEALAEGLQLIKEADAGKTVSGKPIGTPSYMPPEQAEGKIEEIDERSDVWSLGAVLYEILTGQPPYTGDFACEVLSRVLSEPVVPVQKLEPKAPPELAAVCDKCLQKDRGRRYADAGEVAADVAAFQSGGLVSAYDYSMTALVARWVRKRWPVVSTAGIALLVLLIFGAWSFLQIRAQRNEAVAQRALALEQKQLAEQQKAQALKNLSEAYYHQGLRAERESRFSAARLYFLESLVLAGREDARTALYREAVRGTRPLFVRAYLGHASAVTALAVSADGRTLISASCSLLSGNTCGQGELKVWNRESGEAEKTFTAHNWRVNALAVSADGRRLLTGSCADPGESGNCTLGEIKLWSAQEGELKTFTAHTGNVYAVAFSPDGQEMLSAGCGQAAGTGCFEGEVKLWSLAGGEGERTIAGHRGAVFAAVYTPDGRSIVTAGEDGKVMKWSARTGTLEKTMTGHPAETLAVAVSPDSRFALSGSCNLLVGNRCVKGELRLWDLGTGGQERMMVGHEGEIIGVAFSPEGKLAASVSCDERDANLRCTRSEVKLWSMPEGEEAASFPAHTAGVSAIAFSPDGKFLFTAGGDHAIKTWSLANPRPARLLPGHENAVNAVAFSPDGKLLASGASDATVRVWSSLTGEPVITLKKELGDFYCVLFSADGKEVIAGSVDGEISVWSIAGGEMIKTLAGHQAAVRGLALSPDGKRLLSASYDKTLKLWDLSSGNPLQTIEAHDNMIFAVAISPDGKQALSAGMDQTIKLWDLAAGQTLRTLSGHEGIVMSAVFSPDGKTAASAGSDQTIRLWSLETGRGLKILRGHRQTVNAVTFSPDGEYLLSASADGTLKLWSVAEARCVLTLAGHKDMVAGLAVSPDGNWAASASLDLTARLWPLPWDLVRKPADQLLAQAEKETALRLQAFELVPFLPETSR